MTPSRWRQIEELYHAALECAPSQRAALLARANPELRREVESLLAQESGATPLDRPAWEGAASLLGSTVAVLTPGTQLGPYKIESPLAAGGMGEVFRGVDTRLGRSVAVKTSREQFSERFNREARAISSLNHPHICTLYDVGPNYLVMELCEGETLAARLKRGKLSIDDTLRYGAQIADALAAAHANGIVHRDLKPGNIMISKSGVKVLDFGIAKMEKSSVADEEQAHTMTEKGTVLGTLQYMSPEQVQGKETDGRSDIFSFGLVLYEMLTGRRAFEAENSAGIIAAILDREPPNIEKIAPIGLQRILLRCLAKDPVNRYESAGQLQRELKTLETSLAPAPPVKLSRNAWIALVAAVVLVGVLAGWLWRRSSREQWAIETAAPEIARLVDAGEYVKAAALTQEARSALPKNLAIEKLWIAATGDVSIASVPSGAEVSLRPYAGNPDSWQTIGKTPLQKVRVPRGTYFWRIVKPGFVTAFFIGEPAGVPIPGFHWDFNWPLFKLRPVGTIPREMVVVLGGRVSLTYPVGEAPPVQIDDFLIDRHEVTNEEYKKFVDAGGYQKREFWKQPFVRDGRAVPWEQAVALFHDSTGHPGPSTWEVGDYPKGREKYPVAGVSWYEAAAYAEFVGKSLPTAYHWIQASQAARFTPMITPGSNFRREGTQPVGSEGALSGYGTTDMAGNVKEWTLNEGRNAKKLILGGSFREPDYMFNYTDEQSPWDRLVDFGFRCVKLDSPPTAAAAARIDVVLRDYRKETPVSNDVFKAYTALYAYDKGELNARVEETATMEGWSRDKVSFDAAYGGERISAYLFLPKNASPPFQTVVYFPGGFAFFDKLDLSGVEESRGFLLKSGRALIFPIYKGTYDRKDGYVAGRNPPAFFRDHAIAWSKDLGRSLDYLETRKDIDATKLGYFGDSLGASEATRLFAVEKRIKVAILSSGGFQPRHYLPEADTINFVTHVTIPILMLNGRYDSTFPLESSQLPLFHLLGTPDKDKKHVIYEGGHGAFPRPEAVRESLDWLDKYLGPVRP